MDACAKYLAPCAEKVRLRLEGIIAVSYDPVVTSNNVKYAPYDNNTAERDIVLF